MDGKTIIDDARRYREQEELVGKGGVVVFFQGEVQGWVNQLRNPEHWRPGCIAVDEQGRTWTTLAGSERDGALMWLANHELKENLTNLGAITIRCPHCGRPALSSASKGMWCGHCKNGTVR